MVTPDDRMDVPIEQLLFLATECVRRAMTWAAMPAEKFARPEVQALAQAEDEFVHTYRTVLRLRAAEVVRVCERIGLRGCTAAMVRDNPFLVVMAIECQLERLHGGRE
ncbi:MAG: hypothetical protein LC135_03240 [Phycisphaerae bacterium]|nr:hypothetical protein [Phycisphaerae bacterium]MCZ2398869.1 hypothetical protein [Phycisphaerae bacterium]